MAYDGSYYQAPQRPYNGRAAQPPAQAYPPQQQYSQGPAYGSQGQYDQYQQEEYGYNDYGQGHNQQYPQAGGGGGGGGRGQYPPPNQGYPPQQQGYGGGGRGGGNGGGYGRPPPPDNMRGGGGGSGYSNGHGGAPMGRGGRPAPLERSTSSDPGSARRGPPLAPTPISPAEMAWDTPFPSFPGTKKKTLRSEEDKIQQQMAGLDLNGQGGRPKTGNSKSSQESVRRQGDGYGNASRNYPPQEQLPYGRGGPARTNRGPHPQQMAYGGYDNHGYAQQPMNEAMFPAGDDFAPVARSMTMPTDINMNGPPGTRYPVQAAVDSSAPYNGPVGRMPPRPSTATGNVRPPQQRTYPQPQQDYTNGNAGKDDYDQGSREPNESISDLYDAYYDPQDSKSSARPIGRAPSLNSGMPNFDANPGQPARHVRGMSIDGYLQNDPAGGAMPPRQQVNGYPPMNRMKSQPDFRAQAQPQSASYEMANDAPPMPNGYNPGYPDDRYDQYGTHQPPQNGQGRGYGGYNQAGQQDYGLRSPNGPGGRGGPVAAIYNGSLPRSNSLPKPAPSDGGLPPHPAPVRAGLIPNSVAAQANNKPPPVRNYDNTSPIGPQGPITVPSAPTPAPGPAPVTIDELERLKVMVRVNPADQAAQLTLARKWIEASDVLAPLLPDPKARTKARERYIIDANKLLKKLVALNNTEGMFFLADCYGRGPLGLETSHAQAFSLYQSAAKAGHAGAAYRTAVCCELGNEEGGGTRKDPLKAIQWYKRAAMLGDAPAMYKMGMIQLKGLLGQPKNPREAIGWLKRAADRADAENPHSLHELGLLYENPSGDSSIIRDEKYSLQLFTKAAELGYKFSQFRLGAAYEYGLFGLAVDPRLSIMWYSRAAVQEEHQSELALSGWYLTGSEGVLGQSDTEAYLWARKAAMAGLAKAEYAMGYFTEVGIGAPSDVESAKRWYWRAAAQNFPKARERLEELKKNGAKPQLRNRERISRSKVGKQNEGECTVM